MKPLPTTTSQFNYHQQMVKHRGSSHRVFNTTNPANCRSDSTGVHGRQAKRGASATKINSHCMVPVATKTDSRHNKTIGAANTWTKPVTHSKHGASATLGKHGTSAKP